MKLFFQKDYFEDEFNNDNKNDLEQKRNWCERNLIIKDPNSSRLYYLWEIIFLVAFLISIVLVPYTSCRGNEIEYILDRYTKELEIFIDVVWIINITLSFLTPYEQDMGLSDRFVDIARNYMVPGFVFDVLSTLTIIFQYENQNLYYLKFLRAYYFPRSMNILSRVINPIVNWCKISKQARSNVQSIFSQFIILFTIMHMVACGWIYIGEREGWGTWLTNDNFNVSKANGDGTTIYITSLYWVVTTLTTVGYGDIYGTTEEEYIYTMIVEFIGILVFSIIMSTVNSFLSAQGDIDIVEAKSD